MFSRLFRRVLARQKSNRRCFLKPRFERLEDRRVLAVETWTGGDNNNDTWKDNDNWAGVGGAGPGDDLVFPASAEQKTNQNDFDVNTSFSSLAFNGFGYIITGNQIILTGGIVNNPSGTGNPSRFLPNILLDGNETFNSVTGHVELDGVVNLNGHDLTLTGAGNHRFDGQIANTGDPIAQIAMAGSGTVFITGNSPSPPGMIVDAGTMRVSGTLGNSGIIFLEGGTLEGTGSVPRISGFNPLAGGKIAPGNGGTTTGVLTSTESSEISQAITVSIDLKGVNAGSQHDQLNVTGGAIILGGANLELKLGFTPVVGQQFTIVQATGTVTGQFAQGASIAAGGQLFSITYNANSVVLTAQGPDTLTWDGGGADNNWSTAANWNPNLAPQDGVNLVFPAGAPANSLANTNDTSGLDLRSLTFGGVGYNTTGNAITLSHGITGSGLNGGSITFQPNITLLETQTFANSGGVVVLFGNINLNGAGLSIDDSGNVSFFGQITGAGGIVKNGAGTLFLAGTGNNYAGVTQINNGRIEVTSTNGLGATGAGNHTIVVNGATLIVNLDVLNVPEAITLSGAGTDGAGALASGPFCASGCSISGPITLASASTIHVEASTTLTLAGPISGAFGLTKTGDGQLIINGNSSRNGTTLVSAGTLLVNGANSSSPVTVAGGTLGGTGSVGSIVASGGGIIAPGQGLGVFNAFGSVSLNSGSTLHVEIGGASAGTGYDQFFVTGSVNLGAGVANLTGTLINGFTPVPGQDFIILESTSALSGQFAQGDRVTIGGQLFKITYQGVAVVLTAIPQSLSWDGGGANNQWSTAANWNPDFAPVDGLDLVFPAGAPTDSLSTNHDISGLDVRSIAINGAGYTISGNAITLSNGLTVSGSGGLINSPITLSQSQTISSSSNCILQGTINLNGFPLIIDGSFTIAGQITGAGGITKNGAGTLRLQGVFADTSNYTGVTQINGGRLEITRTNALGATGAGNHTVIASGATLSLENSIANVPEAITLDGAGVNGSGALSGSACFAGCSISGPITLASDTIINVGLSRTLSLGGVIGGAFGFTKIGDGTLILGANNSYSGTTTVHVGLLQVNGNNANSPVTVSGGSLGGSGTVGAVTMNAGHLAPGLSVGILSTGNLAFNPGSALQIEINNANATGFDKVIVTGTVSIATSGAGVALNPTKLGTLNLRDGQQLAIIVHNGTADAVQGTFKDLPEGASLGSNFLGSGLTATISYRGFVGNDNDVVLTMSPGSLFPWNNEDEGLDVRGGNSVAPDGEIDAGDALAIINYINAFQAGEIPENAVLGLPFGFLDTDRDNNVTAGDALSVINAINAEGESEGEGSQLSVGSGQLSDELVGLLAMDAVEAGARKKRG